MEQNERNTICDAVNTVKETLQTAYPNSTFFIVASDTHLDEDGKEHRYRIATKHGNQRDLTVETTNATRDTRWLADTCVETALNIIVSHKPQNIKAKSSAALHDAALDYAKYIGVSTVGYEYCRDHPKWKGVLSPQKEEPKKEEQKDEKGTIVHKIGQKVSPLMLEQHITQVRQELKRLEDMRDKSTMQRMIADEVKRLKRKGEFSAAKTLQDELDAHEAEQERKQKIHDERMRNLAKAQEALEVWREKKRRAKQQPPQPNFAKMAKQKRQQIKARQAEKKKKKASGGNGEAKSCSQLLR